MSAPTVYATRPCATSFPTGRPQRPAGVECAPVAAGRSGVQKGPASRRPRAASWQTTDGSESWPRVRRADQTLDRTRVVQDHLRGASCLPVRTTSTSPVRSARTQLSSPGRSSRTPDAKSVVDVAGVNARVLQRVALQDQRLGAGPPSRRGRSRSACVVNGRLRDAGEDPVRRAPRVSYPVSDSMSCRRQANEPPLYRCRSSSIRSSASTPSA